jgi:Cu/Ag efflux pump CusA
MFATFAERKATQNFRSTFDGDSVSQSEFTMSWLIELALRMRIAVLALSAVLIVVGLRLVPSMPLDVFPEFAPPYIEIQTEAPGLSAEEVENLVTFPLENALIGTPGLETLRSKSVMGLSSIRLLLHQNADVYRARQLVQERLASESPRLPNVAIWGQKDKQLQVIVDSERLLAHDVSLDRVLQLVFLPVFFLEGLPGAFFRHLAIGYVGRTSSENYRMDSGPAASRAGRNSRDGSLHHGTCDCPVGKIE